MSGLSPSVLRQGYGLGLFPMAESEEGPIDWYEPYQRCLIPIEGIHVSRSLRRRLRKREYSVTYDQAFEDVMRGCRRPDSWINEELIQAFLCIHREGWAHSCEVWRGEELVGGVYGVAVGAVFCAESKFSRAPDASKVGLFELVHHCRGLGFRVIDAQFINPHTASLGGYEIPQEEYLALLSRLKRVPTPWSARL